MPRMTTVGARSRGPLDLGPGLNLMRFVTNPSPKDVYLNDRAFFLYNMPRSFALPGDDSDWLQSILPQLSPRLEDNLY